MEFFNHLKEWLARDEIIGVFLLATGFGFIVDGLRKLRKRRRLLAGGIQVSGEIVGFSDVVGEAGLKVPLVRFRTKLGETVEVEYPVTTSVPSLLYDQGEKVTVVYDPGKPDIFLIKDERWSVIMPPMLLIAGGIILAWAFFVFSRS